MFEERIAPTSVAPENSLKNMAELAKAAKRSSFSTVSARISFSASADAPPDLDGPQLSLGSQDDGMVLVACASN